MEGSMVIDFQLIREYLPIFFQGVQITLQIAALSCAIGLGFGTVLALIQTSTFAPLRFLVTVYVTLIRGTPMLIQILFAYYALPQFGLHIDTLWIAVIAIGLNSAAYISQILRSGINSIHKGQIEAAQVLGFSKKQIIYYIVLPQAVRVVLPALGNEFITLIKDSSLASIIGVAELSKQSRFVITKTFDAISVYCVVAVLYLTLTSAISLLINYLERKMNHHAKD